MSEDVSTGTPPATTDTPPADGQSKVTQPTSDANVGNGTFDAFYAGLPDEQKSLVDDHVESLKGALKSERNERKSLERKIRELSGAQEQGSEMQAKLESLAQEYAQAAARVAFYEAIAGKGVRNPKLAWIAASQEGMIDKDGSVDLEKLRRKFPELFVPAPANQGAGTASGAPSKPPTMNDFLRASAGFVSTTNK